jgi:hypothetical protein
MADQVLFKFKEYVQLWQTDRNVPNINGPMIQYNTKIYKGATNTIDFVVRNNDRKAVNLIGYQIEALIQRCDQPELLLTKSVIPLNETAGKAQLTLLPGDINDWLAGFYRYTIRLTDVTGKQEFLYTDVNRSTFGTFELIEGTGVALVPSIEIKGSDFTPYPYNEYDNTWTTGALAGDAQDNQSNGLHTVVAYTSDKFLGEFWIQASLTTQPPQREDWFDIRLIPSSSSFHYTEDDSPRIKVFNFTGNYYWVRMFYKSSPKNSGTFDKILYKG